MAFIGIWLIAFLIVTLIKNYGFQSIYGSVYIIKLAYCPIETRFDKLQWNSLVSKFMVFTTRPMFLLSFIFTI